jgi:hypothetical protein
MAVGLSMLHDRGRGGCVTVASLVDYGCCESAAVRTQERNPGGYGVTGGQRRFRVLGFVGRSL